MAADHIAKALQLKDEGNAHFKAGEYVAAMTAYHQIFLYVHGFSEGAASPAFPGQTTRPVSAAEMAQIRELKLAHFSNLALCHLKLGNVPKAKVNCSKALQIDPKNVKALFRRGKCHAAVGALDEAKADWEAVLQMDPQNKEAIRELQALKSRFASHRKKEQKKFAGMFDKLSDGQDEGASDSAAATPPDASDSAARHQVHISSEEGNANVTIQRPPPAAEDDLGEPISSPQPFEPQDVTFGQ
ncbi:hypothetical protein AB1Y20_022753 [Prymnesium parvum]|uniref:Peptidylprolyl isomerase n=1 Tax=Prymnesium parvum TaxID=97485 RepID=A0AB34JIT5_PRYPA